MSWKPAFNPETLRAAPSMPDDTEVRGGARGELVATFKRPEDAQLFMAIYTYMSAMQAIYSLTGAQPPPPSPQVFTK